MIAVTTRPLAGYDVAYVGRRLHDVEAIAVDTEFFGTIRRNVGVVDGHW